MGRNYTLTMIALAISVTNIGHSLSLLRREALETNLKEKQLVLSFVGKGSSVPFDAGVVKAFAEHIPALMDEKAVILTASSSGAIPAIYFSCFGITPESVKKMEKFLVEGDRHIVPALKELRASENPAMKSRVLIGMAKVLSLANLNPYIAATLGIENLSDSEMKSLGAIVNERSQCQNKLPFVIVAANQDILENREDPNSFDFSLTDFDLIRQKIKSDKIFRTRTDKTIDYDSLSVRWKKAYLKEYVSNPEKFKKMNPLLNLREDGLVGKACTYFADPIMASALQMIPYDERLCDIRLVETPADRMRAIQASAAEPTYYDMFSEDKVNALNTGIKWGDVLEARSVPHGEVVDREVSGTRDRVYWGGFVLPLVAQDIRRLLPQVRVVATGFNRLDMNQEGKFIQAMSLVNQEEIAKRSEYWADFAVKIDARVRAQIRGRELNPRQEADQGYLMTKQCIEAELKNAPRAEQCRPLARDVYVVDEEEGSESGNHTKRFFAKVTTSAFIFSNEDKALLDNEENIPVWRGLGPLLSY